MIRASAKRCTASSEGLVPRRGATASWRFTAASAFPVRSRTTWVAGSWGNCAHHPVELHALRFETVAQGVPPADVGAPVRVAPDPARDGEGLGHEFGPAVGPARARGVEQGGVEGIDRFAAVIGGDAGLVELVVEADLRVRPGGEVGRARDQRVAGGALRLARRLGDQGGDGARHAEGRVGGEHHRETRAAHEIAKGLEIALAPGKAATSRAAIRVSGAACASRSSPT